MPAPTDDLELPARALLCSALHGNRDAIEAAAGLPAEAWPDGDLRAIGRALASLRARGAPVDVSGVYAAGQALGLGNGSLAAAISELSGFAAPSCDPARDAKTLREAHAREEFLRKLLELKQCAADSSLADLRHIAEDMDLFSTLKGEGADDWTPANVSEWLESEPPPRDWILRNCLAGGDVGAIAAQGGTGKTFFALQLAISVATGRTLLPAFAPLGARRVLLLAGEDPKDILWRRVRAIVEAFGIHEVEALAHNLIVYAGKSEPLTVPDPNGGVKRTPRYSWLRDQVRKVDPALIIIDPKARFDGGAENETADGTAFIVAIQDLLEEKRAGLILHHVSKQLGETTSSDALRGTTALRDALRWIASMAKPTDAEMERFALDVKTRPVKLEISKANYVAAPPMPTYFERLTGGVLSEIKPTETRNHALASSLGDYIRQHGTLNFRDCRRGNTSAVKDAQDALGLNGRGRRKAFMDAVDYGLYEGLLVLRDGDSGAKELDVPWTP